MKNFEFFEREGNDGIAQKLRAVCERLRVLHDWSGGCGRLS